MRFKDWLIQEKAFDSQSNFTKSPSPPMGLGDLRQMRRWSYMGRPTQPDWQRAAASAVGGFGDAMRDTLAKIGIRPGAPAQWPGPEEYEDPLEIEVFIDEQELGMGELKDVNPKDYQTKAIQDAFLQKGYKMLMSKEADEEGIMVNDYDLGKGRVFDIAYHEKSTGDVGLKASIVYPLKKKKSDKFPDYQTRADQDKAHGYKRGIGSQSVANPKHPISSYQYKYSHSDRDWGR